MKILHIINSLDLGGAQSVLYHLIRDWPEPGDRHEVISLLPPGIWTKRLETLGVKPYHLDLLPGRPNPSRLIRLVRLVRSLQPDLVQTWLYHADLLGGIAARLASRTPVIWGVHHTTPSRGSVKSSTWTVVRLLSILSRRLPARIIYCSLSAQHSHHALGYPPETGTVIFNGVDPDQFQSDPFARGRVLHELSLPPETRMIGMFARNNPQKDFPNFLQAAAKLTAINPQARFILAGQDVDSRNPELTAWIDAAGLTSHVHLLGQRTDMPNLLAAMDIVTLSSAYGEALPISLLEAMACERVCVGTTVGDTERLIGASGISVPPRKPDLLAQAWQTILKLSPEQYHQKGRQARTQVLAEYSLARMVTAYRHTYRTALTNREDLETYDLA